MIRRRQQLVNLIKANSSDADKIIMHLYSGETLSYAAMLVMIEQTQAALRRFGIQPYRRIGLISQNLLFFIPIMVGIIEQAALIPMDPNLTVEQFRDELLHLRVDYIVCDNVEPALQAAGALGIGIISYKFEPTDDPTIDFELIQPSTRPPGQDINNEDIAIIFTTSGTTSKPKIVPRPYQDMIAAIKLEAEYMDFTAKTTHLLVVNIFRFAAIWHVLKTLITNGQMVYVDGMHPKRIADALLRYEITYSALPPAGLFAFHQYIIKNNLVFSGKPRLNLMVFGAPLPYQLKDEIEERCNALILDVYGMTEIGISVTTHKAPQGFKPGSVGYPLVQEFKILNQEVLVKGVGVFPGYENSPYEDNFTDGWFKTGDVGRIDEDGYLYISGRIRELINRGGEKVNPYEVEEAVLSLGSIEDVSVFPYPNQQGSDDVGAAIVLASGTRTSLRELRAGLKEKIRPYKLPTLLYVMDKIPASAAGKIQRNLLYEQLRSSDLEPQTLIRREGNLAEPANATEAFIRGVWKEVLEQPDIALNDEFFDLGGDSLDAAEILASIEAHFECIIPIKEFYQRNTVRQLASLVDDLPKRGTFKHIVPINAKGHKTPLFLVHALYGDVMTYQHLAEFLDPQRPLYGLALNYQQEHWDASLTLQIMAQTYVDEVRRMQPQGPYYMGGVSMGGAIAFEMAVILDSQGEATKVIMLNTPAASELGNARASLTSVLAAAWRKKYRKLRNTPKSEWVKLFATGIKPRLRRYSLALELKMTADDPTGTNQILENSGKEHSELKKNIFLNNHVFRKYQAGFYPGTIYYFRAIRLRDVNYLGYWQTRAKQIAVKEVDCGHDDFVRPYYAADTAREIEKILEPD